MFFLGGVHVNKRSFSWEMGLTAESRRCWKGRPGFLGFGVTGVNVGHHGGFKAPGCLSHCEAQTVWQALRALAASWDLTILLRVSDLIPRLVPLSQNLSWIRFRTSFGSLFNKNLSTSTCHDKRWLATIIAPSGFWLCRAMLRESVVWSFWTSHQKSWSVPSQRQTWTDTPPGRSLLITLW